MGLNLGSTPVAALRLGNTAVSRVMLGDVQVWPPAVEPPPGGRLWTPADIATTLFLDGSDALSKDIVGSRVSEWRDKSGQGRHFGNNNDGTRPSNNALGIIGNQGFLSRNETVPAGVTTRAHFIVARIETSAFIASVFAGVGYYSTWTTNSADNWTFDSLLGDNTGQSGADVLAFLYQPANNGADVTHTFNTAAAQGLISMMAGYWDGGANTSAAWLNGVAAPDTTPGDSAWPATAFAGSQVACIGRYLSLTSTGWRLHSELFCVIETTAPILIANREKLEGWAAHTFGITAQLPANHPYKNAPPTTVPTPPPTELWTPADLGAVLQGWWDSSDPLQFTLDNTDRVQEWRAKGTSGLRLTVGQTDGARQPQRTAAGVNGLNGSARLQGRQAAGGPMPIGSSFICFDQTISAAASTFETILSGRERTQDLPFLGLGSADGGQYNLFAITPTATSPTAAWLDGTQLTEPQMVDLRDWAMGYTFPSGGSSLLYSALSLVNSGNNQWWILLNDATDSNTRGWSLGPVQQVMLFARELTTDERQRVEGWTAHTIGQLGRLPANHPYKNAPPTR